MVENMKVNLKMIKDMDMVLWLIKMGKKKLDIGIKEN